MIISEEELKRRLEHQENLKNKFAPTPEKKTSNDAVTGRIINKNSTTMFQRVMIGSLANMSKRGTVAPMFDADKNYVNRLKHGHSTNYNEPEKPQNAELAAGISKTLIKAKATAADLVMLSLGLIKESDITELKVKDKMVVAEKAANIVDRLTPKENSAPTQNNQIVIYAPKQRDESEMETITIRSLERG